MTFSRVEVDTRQHTHLSSVRICSLREGGSGHHVLTLQSVTSLLSSGLMCSVDLPVWHII